MGGGGLGLLILLARKRLMSPLRNGAIVSGSYSRKYMIPPMHMQKRATCKRYQVTVFEKCWCMLCWWIQDAKIDFILKMKGLQRKEI